MVTPYMQGAAPGSATPTTATPHVGSHGDTRDRPAHLPLFDPAANPDLTPRARDRGRSARRRQGRSLDRVLAALRRGPLTALDALRLGLGMRLGARVLELRQLGHEIRTERVSVTNADGSTSPVARYVLVREAAEGGAP